MNNQSYTFPLEPLRYSILFAALLAVSSMFVFGQELQPSGTGSLPRPGDAHYYEYTSACLRSQSKPATVSSISLQELREEFLKLQISNNNLFDLRKKTNDPGTLAGSLGEIRKRAAALKRQLPLPALDQSAQTTKTVESIDLDATLDLLDQTVLRFAASPAFKNAGVLEVEAGAQARQDLESILTLSESLLKRLSRSGARNQD